MAIIGPKGLAEHLSNALEDLSANKIDHDKAQATASLASQLINTYKLVIEASKAAAEPKYIQNSGFFDAPPILPDSQDKLPYMPDEENFEPVRRSRRR